MNDFDDQLPYDDFVGLPVPVFSPRTWVTQHQQRMHLCEMLDSHLINTIRCLWNNYTTSDLHLPGYFNFWHFSHTPAQAFLYVGAMLEELERRGITPKFA